MAFSLQGQDFPPTDVLDFGRCGPHNADLFDPVDDDEIRAIGHREVWRKRIRGALTCAECPVKVECLEDGLKRRPASRQATGVYGGVYITGRGAVTDLVSMLGKYKVVTGEFADELKRDFGYRIDIITDDKVA